MTSVDNTQWIATYARLEKPLYNVVYRVLWNAAESQDVVQEAFLRCWRRKSGIRADGFTALLYSTALNLARNRRRRARLWRMAGVAALADVAADSDAAGAGGEPISSVVRAAFDSLPEAWRDVVLLTEIAGMTYPEAAAALGVAEGTIGSRRSRALKWLRERLELQGVVSHEC
jgi:RNA polymerase sigma-70 factor, ECF subfamily